ncbi:MAG TPA: papain-like cysteine protease family protein [Gemmatimonadaceae bacterium]|nr:papain-like cysteine protease family protein [Gemmatimonadaceae bacterium]
MQNRIASLFALDELLGAKTNGHNGNGGVKRPRRKKSRAVPNVARPAKPAARRSYTPGKRPAKTYAQSFDAGAPIRCEHSVAYQPVEPVQVPAESASPGGGAAAMAFDVDDGYTVEAFEDEDEEEDLPTELPALEAEYSDEDDQSPGPVRATSYEEDAPRFRARSDYERTQPAFAAQMNAVEQDLADLATRVQQPAATPEASAPLPVNEDEQDSPSRSAPPVKTSGHGVFDSMAQGMSYATEFRLPPVQLSQVFSALDRQLDADEVANAPAPAPIVVTAAPRTVQTVPPNEVLIKDLVDLPPPPPAVTQPAPATAVAAAAIDVRHDVQLVPQLTGFSCWAAGAAMLVGWRDKMSIDPSAIARATGYWAQYAQGLHAEDGNMFKVWRLTPEPAQTYTVQGFADLLRKHGPLWVASAEPGPHIRVVTGMVGDGTPTGTLVYINDPWEQGMQTFRADNRGSRYTETYQRFVEKQSELGRREINLQGIYVAHN